jgi:hypothetical protein
MPVVPSTTPAITLSDLVEETKRHLFSMERVELNRLTSTINSSVTALACDFNLNSISRGSYIEVDDELLYVWTVSLPTSVTVMQRAMLGTTAASHTSGALITVNPKFPQFAIKKALQEEIRSWGPDLYQLVSATIPMSASRRGYELTDAAFGNFYQVVEVRRSNVTVAHETDPKSWPRINNYRLLRNAPTSDFPSGNAIILPDEYNTPLPSLHVTVSAPFDVNTSFTNTTDMLDSVGLAESMVDVAPLGAAWRLMMTREVRRTELDVGTDPASAKDIPAGYLSQTAGRLKALRDDRISSEAKKLQARLPSGGWG